MFHDLKYKKFVGAISDKPTQKQFFITTSDFSKEAINYAKNIQNLVIILINGDSNCVILMVKHKVGVYVKQTIELCEIDRDFLKNNLIRKISYAQSHYRRSL